MKHMTHLQRLEAESIFITSVCTRLPEAYGLMPSRTPSWLVWTMRSRPSSRARRSRNSIISRNFQVVST